MANKKPSRKIVSLRDYKLKQLADVYGISPYLMRKRIKKHQRKIGNPDGQYYLFEQVQKIFELIKLPSTVVVV
jgi:hypothetical protein